MAVRDIACSSRSVMVCADFNRDGTNDIAVTTGGGLSLLLGRGGGALGPATRYPYNSFGPGALATGDFNRDGKLDLVEADWYDTRTFLNDGAGNLSVRTNQSGDGGFATYPAALVVGDLNGDDQADIAVANSGNPSRLGIALGFGRGDGFFDGPTNCALPNKPGDIVLGDLNGDGLLEAAVSLYSSFSANSNSVCVLTNTGNGALAVSQTYGASARDNHYSLRFADFNGAVGLDLVVLNSNARSVTIRLNDGSGVLGPAQDYPVGCSPHSLVVDDFDGDGRLDLMVRDGYFVQPLLGHGDGSFAVAPPLLPVGAAARSPGTMVAGDFDNNGTSDLAFTDTTTGSVTIKLNQTPPVLEITPGVGGNQITWLSTFGMGYSLEWTSDLLVPGSWLAFSEAPVLMGNRKSVTDRTDGERRFYRLRKP